MSDNIINGQNIFRPDKAKIHSTYMCHSINLLTTSTICDPTHGNTQQRTEKKPKQLKPTTGAKYDILPEKIWCFVGTLKTDLSQLDQWLVNPL